MRVRFLVSLALVTTPNVPLSLAASSLEVVQTASAPCADDGSGQAIAVSPDGQFVYEGGTDWRTLADGVIRVSARNATTGDLTPVQYLTGAAGGIGLGDTVGAFAASPGWEHLYVSSNTLDVFARNAATGVLAYVESHPAGNAAISDDGAHVYAVAGTQLTAYARNVTTGALTALAQHALSSAVAAHVVVSPDGQYVYVSPLGFGNGSTFSRDAGTGALTFVGFHSAVGQLLITPDGAYLYAAVPNVSGGSLRVFSRDTVTGALTLVDAENEGAGGLPADWFPTQISLSPDGAQLYASGVPVVVFTRSLVDGSLTFFEQQVDQVGGLDGLAGAADVAATTDGSHVYTIGEGTVTFARTGPNGALTFLGNRETEGLATAVVVSPDGAHAYRVCMRGIEVFDRAPSGQLTSASSLPLDSLDFAQGAYFPPDGEHLYVRQGLFSFTSQDRLLVLDRDPGTGALSVVTEYDTASFGDGFRHLAFSADGSYLYVTGLDSLRVLARNAVTGMLALVDTEQGGLSGVPEGVLDGMSDVVPSPDGDHVYVGTNQGFASTNDGIVIFDRDSGTGAVTFAALLTVNGGGAGSLAGVAELAIGPDGLGVHAAGSTGGGVDAIATYARTPSTGALAFVSAMRENTAAAGTLDSPRALSINPAGTHLYAAGPDGAVHVLRRDLATGALGFVHTLPIQAQYFAADEDGAVTLSPDGEQAYAIAMSGDVSVLATRTVCSATPQSPCGGADAAAVKVVEKVGPSDLVVWKWKAPGAIAVGDPLATTELAFCVYDGSARPQPVVSSLVEPGGTCGTKPCWAPNSVGYKYVDKVGSPDGVTKVRLLTGSSGTAKIVLKGKGAALPPLALPYTTPVVVQLQASNGECWEAAYASPTIDHALQFKATQ